MSKKMSAYEEQQLKDHWLQRADDLNIKVDGEKSLAHIKDAISRATGGLSDKEIDRIIKGSQEDAFRGPGPTPQLDRYRLLMAGVPIGKYSKAELEELIACLPPYKLGRGSTTQDAKAKIRVQKCLDGIAKRGSVMNEDADNTLTIMGGLVALVGLMWVVGEFLGDDRKVAKGKMKARKKRTRKKRSPYRGDRGGFVLKGGIWTPSAWGPENRKKRNQHRDKYGNPMFCGKVHKGKTHAEWKETLTPFQERKWAERGGTDLALDY